MKRALSISALLLAIVFKVLSQDITPPVIHGGSISPLVVGLGDTITVELDLTDDISGIDISNVSIHLKAVFEPGATYTVVPTITAPLTNISGSLFKTSYRVPTYSQYDSLSILYLTVYDIAGNFSQMQVDTLPVGHPLRDRVDVLTPPISVADTIPPVLDSVWFTLDTLGVYDTVKFNFLAHDNISTASLKEFTILDSAGDRLLLSARLVPNGDTISYHMPIPKYGDNGVFTLSELVIKDHANNLAYFYDMVDFSEQFVIQGRIPDHEKPTLLGIEFSKDTLHRGDSLSIYIAVRDTISGIQEYNHASISISIFHKGGQQNYIPQAPVTVIKDSLYRFDVAVGEFAANGTWGIWYLSVVDSNNNIIDRYDSLYRYMIDSTQYVVIDDSLTLISGNIRTSTGAPLQNSRVYTVKFSPNDSLLISNRATSTDLNGDYRFVSEMRDSNVYIKAIPNDTLYPNEIPTYWDSTWLITNANMLVIDTNNITVDTFATLTGSNTGGHGFITGYIWQGAGKNSPGEPVANLDLVLVNAQGQPIAFATTNAAGLYQFTNIADGTYRIYGDWIGIDNALAPSLTLTADSYELTDMDFKVEAQQLVALTTGIEEVHASELGIYPNPSTGILYIRTTEGRFSGEVNISIVNMGGKQVHHSVIDSEQSTVLDLSELNNGLYLILLTDGEQSISSRVQIQR